MTRPTSLGADRLTMEPPPHYPGAMVNVTNRCNLACEHCFIFREGNPNELEGEMKPERILAELERLRDRHGIRSMMWMGGEPMLRWRMIEQEVDILAKLIQLCLRNHAFENIEAMSPVGVKYVWVQSAVFAVSDRAAIPERAGRPAAFLDVLSQARRVLFSRWHRLNSFTHDSLPSPVARRCYHYSPEVFCAGPSAYALPESE